MSGFHILTPSWTSGSTVGSASFASNLTFASNLLTVQSSRRWRSDGLGIIHVNAELEEPRPWDTVALLYTNADDGTIRVSGNNSFTGLYTSPAFAFGPQVMRFPGDLSTFPWRHVWVYTGTVTTSSFVGIEIIDDNNPDEYFEAGVLMIGKRFTPRIGPDIGSTIGRDDPSTQIRLLNGEAIVRPKRGFDVAELTFPMQPQADAIQWLEINRTYGSKIPIIAKWDPVSGLYEQHTFIYGYAQWPSSGALTYANGKGLYDVEMGIVEL